ncbi:UvrD-helicase domain-containing protein [Nocardia sp. NPDC052566]|uniref:UvrD-helicase domain-containing protein n=1 Tax=Nocardia sp. NPDC052566 TaxID=3364330 RepID=UPI0037CB05A7
MPAFEPTAEQLHIHDLFRTGKPLLIRAGAGTGKTTTLQQLSQILQQENRLGLYLAFNRAIAVEAQRKFPTNVTAKTSHALARKGISVSAHAPLLDKMGAGRIPLHVTGTRLGIRSISVSGADGSPRLLTDYKVTRHVIRTLDEFCKTADEHIGPQHVPAMVGLDTDGATELAERILPWAEKAWRDVSHPNGDAIKFGHNHYLKLWQLMHPRIGRPGAALFLDEAQDTSPVLAAVIAEQDHLHRVFVGDRAQSIYAFTGAVDSMENFGDAAEGRLTQSWRFGRAIAEAANEMLAQLGDDMRLVGNPARESRIVTGPQHPHDAILTRTNGTALAHVIAALAAGRTVHMMGGDSENAVRFCDSAEKLKAGQPASHEDLAAFTTWGQVQEYAEDSPDATDLKVWVRLIDDHGVDALRNALTRLQPEDRASLVVSTAHRSKGREFERVRLADDLAEALDKSDRGSTALRQERMLAYVAITRAKMTLDPGALASPADSAPVQLLPATSPPSQAVPPPAETSGNTHQTVSVSFTDREIAALQRLAGNDLTGWLRDTALSHLADKAS